MQIRHVRIFLQHGSIEHMHLQTILGFLNKVLRILLKNVGKTLEVLSNLFIFLSVTEKRK